jgi:branched-chain amino acid transport system substrate-binding protein
VTVASVGCLSGPAGVTLAHIFQGAQLWVKYINTKGGLRGHAVNLIAYDDGCDPARHRAQVQEAVEQRKAIAFLANMEPFTGEPSIEYVNQKRIPVIGFSLGEAWDYSSPMYFPQASAGDAAIYTSIAAAASQLVPEGKTKLAVVLCTEAQLCRDADRTFSDAAGPLGFELVYRATTSLAQPDFTAECLNARNAGAQVVLILLDANSVSRFAGSCARQGYRPNFATLSSLAVARHADDPNLAGMTASTMAFPWFQSGTSATDEFQQAYRTLGSGITPGVGPATGWTAGKLLERAAINLPEPPTNEAILKGLWSIKDDNLGGLTHPLTFVEGQPAKPISCWFDLRIKNKVWSNPDGFGLHCKPAPKTSW